MLRSSAAASPLVVTAAHVSAVSSPRTEVSSMNWATSAGCCSRTSEMKNSVMSWQRIQRPRDSHRVLGATKRQRHHLQHRGPPLAAMMKQLQVSSGNLDAEVRQQLTAMGQREV